MAIFLVTIPEVRLKLGSDYGVKSTWSKLKIETTTVDIAKQTVIRQADAIKAKENELLIGALNAVIGETPTAWDIDVKSSGVLTYADLRNAAMKLQSAKHYASQKYPYICFVNETEAQDLLADTTLTSNQNILSHLFYVTTFILQ